MNKNNIIIKQFEDIYDINKNNYQYDNIISLARKAGLKKIMVMRNSWSYGNWAIVNKINLKDNLNEKYSGCVLGYIQYKNGCNCQNPWQKHNREQNNRLMILPMILIIRKKPVRVVQIV